MTSCACTWSSTTTASATTACGSTCPLPERASSSVAECAFGTVERGLTAEGGPTEQGLATYPSRRFVTAGGLTVAHEGLLEYELIDLDEGATSAATLAVTLLRCTGMLSQGPMATRPAAGRAAHRRWRDRSRSTAWRRASPCTSAAATRTPSSTTPSSRCCVTRGGRRPAPRARPTGRRSSVTGAEVSAITREAGALLVRVFNPSPLATTVTIDGRQGWLLDLRGRPQRAFEERFELAPWQIATAALA